MARIGITLAERLVLGRLTFASKTGLTYDDVKTLIVTANAAFRAGEVAANEGTDAAQQKLDNRRRLFDRMATRMGFTVSWPGLYPLLHKAGDDLVLPD